jgi:hypothetical protein
VFGLRTRSKLVADSQHRFLAGMDNDFLMEILAASEMEAQA